MHTLFAPWRMDYIKQVADGPKECFLCAAAKSPDRDAELHILHRAPTAMLLLNKFPYVNGHLLVAPYRHVPTLADCTPEERAQIMELFVLGQKRLFAAMNPHGFNLGFNIGRCAGAGVPGHVHGHIVPRWNGDINFMDMVGEVKVIPQSLAAAYTLLQAAALMDSSAAPPSDADTSAAPP